MKKFVWLAGALLLISLIFPNGIPVKAPVVPTPPAPVVPEPPVVPVGEVNARIVELLAAAPKAERDRMSDAYTGLKTVTLRDAGKRVNTTEKWSELQANTLQLAIDTPGKYPGLDAAIEGVFAEKLGTDDVVAITPEITQRLVKACEVVSASAQTYPPSQKK